MRSGKIILHLAGVAALGLGSFAPAMAQSAEARLAAGLATGDDLRELSPVHGRDRT